MREHYQSSLQAQAIDELLQRLAKQSFEDPMKMKRRKVGNLRHILELMRLVEVLDDVVDGTIDPLDIVERAIS